MVSSMDIFLKRFGLNNLAPNCCLRKNIAKQVARLWFIEWLNAAKFFTFFKHIFWLIFHFHVFSGISKCIELKFLSRGNCVKWHIKSCVSQKDYVSFDTKCVKISYMVIVSYDTITHNLTFSAYVAYIWHNLHNRKYLLIYPTKDSGYRPKLFCEV